MAAGEVTPGVSLTEYQARREAVAAELPPGSLALWPAAPQAFMAHDVPYIPYLQDTDLFYLCGFQEHSSLLACARPADSEAQWHLFVRPACEAEAVWDGRRAGVECAHSYFLPEGCAHSVEKISRVLEAELLPQAAGAAPRRTQGILFYEKKVNPLLDARLAPLLASAAKAAVRYASPASLVHPLRSVKSAAELELMRRSASVCTAAMRRTMMASREAAERGYTEASLSARFEFECRVAGAERLAYPSVVAGGANAVTLHYMHNNAVLRPGQLLLMDAGASLHGYASDLTRTWPLSGTFTPAQRDLYAAVLDVNERVIEACRSDAGASIHSLHRLSVQWTYEHLLDLGVLSRDDPQALAKCQRYYPHNIGHFLGLDVHDTPSVGSGTRLQPGMVITVEPGLYFPEHEEALPEWCRGVGIRIEDDVVIGRAGEKAEVLTADAPKTARDIEALLCERAAQSSQTSRAPT